MNPVPEDTARSNLAWGKAVASCLGDLQVTQVFFSPGSRSTPLVLAFERHPNIECIPVLDERSAAFLALGSSKRNKVPAVLICTSGSAPTHWFPAVTEASHASIPLLLLSADRPSELQDCGAGQTINQSNLFGSFVRAFHPLPIPDSDFQAIKELEKVLSLAHEQTLDKNPGPVHLNFPFREPLFLEMSSLSKAQNKTGLSEKKSVSSTPKRAETINLADKYKHPIIIAGEYAPHNLVDKWTKNRPHPILCDSLSNIRENDLPNRILRYENLLRDSTFIKSAKPDLIIVLGPLPTSKTLRNWIDQTGSFRVVIEPRGKSVDPLTSESHSIEMSYEELENIKLPVCDQDWTNMWKVAEKQVEEKITFAFAEESSWFEGKLTRLLSLHMPSCSSLLVANSMPVRDLEWFWKPSDLKRKLYGNRGVNGIDGSISTALGIAHQNKEPTFLLTGDLAFLHDANSLLFRPYFIGSLSIFLINNQGGGIFENLAVSKVPEFEKCFATPQCCDFTSLCAAYEVEYVRPNDWADVVHLIKNPLECGIRVIEIQSDRKMDRDIRQNMLSLFPNLNFHA